MSAAPSGQKAAQEASLRRLHALVRGINGDLDLDRTLEAVTSGIVEGLGFEVTVINMVQSDGDFEVVAVAGSDEARETLLGQRGQRAEWERWMSLCTPVGALLVDYRRLVDDGSDVPTWVPDRPISDDEDAWHPLDAVIAPLRTSRSGLLGTLSVDLPRDGRRPTAETLELLEMYAAQASVAIENAALHTALVTRDAEREQALGRLTAVLGEVPAAILEVDLDGRIRTWNPAAEEMFGWSADEVIGKINPTVDPDGYDAGLAELKRGQVDHRQSGRRRRKDGSMLDVEMSSAVLTDAEGDAFGYIGVISDVTHRVAMERELRHAAFHDPLTGLANRAMLRDRLDQLSGSAKVSLLLLDLDGFKAVNDSLGHEVGDQVLLEVSRRLARSCRPSDLLVRLGGDEFVALVEGDQERAITLADRFLRILSEPIALSDRDVALGCSIGIASPSEHGADSALRDADIAMYVAKSKGKGRYQVFAPALRDSVLDRAALSDDLRSAVAGNQLTLRYHPVIDVKTRAVVAFEALLRWNHPTRGELSPLLFIPLAEESGVIHEIGDWVLVEACSELRRMQTDVLPENSSMTVSVNLSAVQLHSAGLVERVQQILAETGLEPRRLVLELTESVLVEDVEDAVRVLGRLRSIGVRLALDDFGAGYSSLRYLKRLPFDIVKLDKGLLDGVDRDPAALALADAVLGLLNRLGLRTCAEGIETAAQLAVVESLGCELGQGFLVAKPLRPAELHSLLVDGWPAPPLPAQRDGRVKAIDPA
ncbi:MAG: diguanylate cyclase/phosphodiesterase with sensor(s) [Frankiales bacterium]|nr:diguanylate cyclase/phosphodiesterase with sensor(s) [Frankiales bacterium]